MLIDCPECGKQISDQAAACPHCGCPQDVWKKEAVYDSAEENRGEEEGASFPFSVLERHEHYVLVQCERCKEKFMRGIQEIKEENGKTVFPMGMNCRKCGASTASGSWYTEDENAASRSYCAPTINSTRPVASATPTSAPLAPRPQEIDGGGRRCPRCGGNMTVQVVTEQKSAGCLTVLLYIILALTLIGLLIVIPLALRKKTETVTYAVCQKCGYQQELRRT